MAFDAFLKIDSIPGESTDDKHKGEIEISSFSWGLSQHASAASTSTAGGRAGERAQFQDMSFTKHVDKASPKLFLACATGQHIKHATLTLNRATGDKQKYLEVKMEDVLISSYSDNGSGGDDFPTDQVSLNFGKIEVIYTETDHGTGKSKGDVKAHWDLKSNKGG